MAELPRFPNNLINVNTQLPASLGNISLSGSRGYAEQAIALANTGKSVANAAIQLAKDTRDAERAEANAYLANLTTEDLTQTETLFAEAQDQSTSPDQFSTMLGEYQANKLKNIPDSLKEEYKLQSDRRNAVLSVRYSRDFLRKAKDKANKKLYTSQKLLEQQLLSNPEVTSEIESEQKREYLKQYEGILNSRVQSGFLTSDEKELQKHKFNIELTTATLKRKLEDQTPEQRAKTILDLQTSKNPPKSFTFADKNKLISALVSHNHLLKQVEAEVFSEAKSIERVKKSMENGQPLDYRSGQDKADVETTYTATVLPELDEVANPDLKASLIADFVKKTHVVPQHLQSEIRKGLSTTNIQDNIYYSDLFSRIAESNPQIVRQFSKSDVSKAQLIAKGMRAGGEPEAVIEQVTSQLEKVQSGGYKILKDDYKNRITEKGKDIEIDGKKVVDIINDIFDTTPFFPFFDPKVSNGLEDVAINDYLQRYESWYTSNGGNADLAKKNADRDFKSNWGITNINGSKEVTKYPIETAYTGMEAKDIRKQLTDEVRKLDEKFKDVEEDKIFLQWDLETAREYYDVPPKYKVLIQDKNGNLAGIINPDGSYMRWSPDYNKWRTKKKEHNKKLREEALEKERLRERSQELLMMSTLR